MQRGGVVISTRFAARLSISPFESRRCRRLEGHELVAALKLTRGDELIGARVRATAVACGRRQKKWERAPSKAEPAAQIHACTGSPAATCAMTAEVRSMKKPQYAHSLSRGGTGNSSSAIATNLAIESAMRKYDGKPRCVKAMNTSKKRTLPFGSSPPSSVCRWDSPLTRSSPCRRSQKVQAPVREKFGG